MKDFQDRIVLVTGGASGIGLAMAQAFADEGARIALADIDEARLAQVAPALDALAISLDISGRQAWARAKRLVEQRLGPVDILCNNAGIASDGCMLAEMDPEAFDRMMRITLTGTFNGISCFAASMMARGSGHVVTTASLAGLIHPARVGAYCAAKAGVVALSEVLAAEAGPHGVGVTIVCPGRVKTRISETTLAAGSDRPAEILVPNPDDQIMEPSRVAEMTIRAVKEGALYAVTHACYESSFRARIAPIFAAFEHGE